jgi:hypothetical protein
MLLQRCGLLLFNLKLINILNTEYSLASITTNFPKKGLINLKKDSNEKREAVRGILNKSPFFAKLHKL